MDVYFVTVYLDKGKKHMDQDEYLKYSMEMAAAKPTNKGQVDCNRQWNELYGEIDLYF